jgi:hypothetical protein
MAKGTATTPASPGVDPEKGSFEKELEKPTLARGLTSASNASEITKVEEPVLAYDKRSWSVSSLAPFMPCLCSHAGPRVCPLWTRTSRPRPKARSTRGCCPRRPRAGSACSRGTGSPTSSPSGTRARSWRRTCTPHRSAELIADKILASYDRRTAAADAYNAKLARGEVGPGWRRAWWALRGGAKERELKWREGSGRRKPSLTLACNDAIFRWFWIGGFLKFLSDMAQTTSPLVLKVGPAH